MTGLSEDYLERADLRVTPSRFYRELLRDRGLSVGRLDSRYTGRDYDSAGEEPDNDPSFYGIDAGYTAAINQHMREVLGFRTDRSYVTIGPVGPWDWRLGQGRDSDAYLNVAPYIGRALRENSGLRVFVGQGYYDFATPFFAAEYSLADRHPARPDQLALLRFRPHDVRPRRRPRGAEPRRARVHPGSIDGPRHCRADSDRLRRE